MKCVKCNVNFVIGIAIESYAERFIAPKGYDSPKLISVLKCPKCGYSITRKTK